MRVTRVNACGENKNKWNSIILCEMENELYDMLHGKIQ